MAIVTFDINNKEVVNFANKLEQMRRSDFPVTVRQTLNNMAFDVKKKTLLKHADKNFIIRRPSFFKRFSAVQKANGFDVNTMYSEVGISPGTNLAAKNLSKQEKGGKISGRSFIYMDQSRIGGQKSKVVSRRHYLSSKGIIKGRPNKKRPRKSQFVADAIVAKEQNKFMIQNTKSGMTAFIVKKIKFSGRGQSRKAYINTVAAADYEAARSVTVQARPFVRPASIESGRKGVDFFIKQYERRIKKRIV